MKQQRMLPARRRSQLASLHMLDFDQTIEQFQRSFTFVLQLLKVMIVFHLLNGRFQRQNGPSIDGVE